MNRFYICKITILGHLARKKQVLDSFLLVNPKKWTLFFFFLSKIVFEQLFSKLNVIL